MGVKRLAEIAFSALTALVFVYFVLEARNWRFEARLFPWIIGLPMVGLALAQLYMEIRKKGENASGTSGDALAVDFSGPVARQRAVSIVAWIFASFVAIVLLGFPIAVLLFTFLYLKVESGESWWLSALLSIAAWGFLYLLFDRTLHIPFATGQLLAWLGF